MEFNVKKCKVMEMDKGGKRSSWNDKMGNGLISRAQKEKDLGVTFQNVLSSDSHIVKIPGETYKLLKILELFSNIWMRIL